MDKEKIKKIHKKIEVISENMKKDHTIFMHFAYHRFIFSVDEPLFLVYNIINNINTIYRYRATNTI